jgi:cysteinyl-tRNA synthetase
MKDMAAPQSEIPSAVMDALADDLNTPQALAELNGIAKEENSPRLKSALLAAGKILGILQRDPAEWLGYGAQKSGDNAQQIEDLLRQRQAAKAAKNFARADEIRDELAAQGIAVEDTPQGPKWRRL